MITYDENTQIINKNQKITKYSVKTKRRKNTKQQTNTHNIKKT